MPLSEHEQRLFDEIESALYADDPKFANVVRKGRVRWRVRRAMALAVAGVLVGLGLVLVGLLTTIVAISVAGFVVLVLGCVVAVQSARHRGSQAAGPAASGARGSSRRDSGLRARMEDRVRRRFDDEF